MVATDVTSKPKEDIAEADDDSGEGEMKSKPRRSSRRRLERKNPDMDEDPSPQPQHLDFGSTSHFPNLKAKAEMLHEPSTLPNIEVLKVKMQVPMKKNSRTNKNLSYNKQVERQVPRRKDSRTDKNIPNNKLKGMDKSSQEEINGKKNPWLQAILSICAASVATLKLIPERIASLKGQNQRPRVLVGINDQVTKNFLYDTGAARTCLTLATFLESFPKGHPRVNNSASGDLRDAGGNSLGLYGIFNVPLTILGRRFYHEVTVLKHLTEDIIGIDIIHQQKLAYDTEKREVFYNNSAGSALAVTSSTFLPALSTTTVRTRFYGNKKPFAKHIATVYSPQSKLIMGGPALVKIQDDGTCHLAVTNCAPYDIQLARGSPIGIVEEEDSITNIYPVDQELVNNIISSITAKEDSPKLRSKKRLTRAEIEKRANLNVPIKWKEKYLDILERHSEAISVDKHDLGRATNYKHRIHLKSHDPIYRKQFKIPEAHKDFIEATISEWLKLGIVKRSQSMFNSPIFCVPKKNGQGLRIVQDFRALNANSYIDKYSIKEVSECIGDIGRAGSTIFSTLDLTSSFWQMPLHPDDTHKTAFTIPGKGQFEWLTSPMGLLGCPASFQRLMEMVLVNIKGVIVYIDDLLIHSKDHESHLKTLEEVFNRLQQHGIKVNLNKCLFGNPEVSYLGFVLTPNGISPGKDKLKAIRDAKPPTDIKTIKSFIGLCNFFRTHIRNFSRISAPLTRLTRKDSEYKGGPLPKAALDAFKRLQRILISNPVVDYPRSDRKYALIVDAATGTEHTEGGIGAILTQIDAEGNFHVISYGSRQLQKHEKNYSPYLLEMAAACWGMDFYHEYLKGKKFILFSDHKPLEKLGHLHTKTLNRLQLAMLEYDFEIQYKKGIQMPADYMSREVVASLSQKCAKQSHPAIDPFSPDLQAAQRQDPDIKNIQHYFTHNSWPATMTRQEINKLLPYTSALFSEDKILWIRLKDANYPRVALFLPQQFRKGVICAAHGALLTGHDALKKTYIRVSSCYWWPNIKTDIQKHIHSCLQCQVRKRSFAKPVPLQPLPTMDQPNQRVHVDLFGPLKTSTYNNKFILCITDAFTKYAEVIAIPDKKAETVANEIFINWICRFGTPIQIHSDGGKEFVNKLSKEMFDLLDIKHTKTSPAHPQCNAQVEVFNKTVAKYLSSFVDETTFDWEQYLPALRFSYNTSYHSTIRTTPYELLFGMRPRTPNFPAQDLQRIHYGESFASERLRLLKEARRLAEANTNEAQTNYKEQHDKRAKPHDFCIGQKVLYSETNFLNKNKKLAPKWLGPAVVLNTTNTNVTIRLPKGGKKKKFNVQHIKHFYESEDEMEDKNLDEEMKNENHNDDVTGKDQKEEDKNETFKGKSRTTLETHTKNSQPDSLNQRTRPVTRSMTKLMKDESYIASVVKMELVQTLDNIAYKLYSQKRGLHELTQEEKGIWTSIPLGDIFQLLTGDPLYPPDYWSYVIGTSTKINHQQEPNTLPRAEPEARPSHQPQDNLPEAGGSRKRGRPKGSKNKPASPLDRITRYASKRIQELQARRIRAFAKLTR